MKKKQHPRRKVQRYYSDEVWSTIRSLYESGQFHSMAQVRSHCGKLGIKIPSARMIEKRCAEESWNKHANEEKVKERVCDQVIQMFADQGMPTEKAVKLYIEGMTAGEGDIDKLVDKIQQRAQQIAEGGEEEDAAAAKAMFDYIDTINMLRGAVNVHGTRFKYLDGFGNIRGWKAPVELHKEVSGSLQVTQDKADDEAYLHRMAGLSKRKRSGSR